MRASSVIFNWQVVVNRNCNHSRMFPGAVIVKRAWFLSFLNHRISCIAMTCNMRATLEYCFIQSDLKQPASNEIDVYILSRMRRASECKMHIVQIKSLHRSRLCKHHRLQWFNRGPWINQAIDITISSDYFTISTHNYSSAAVVTFHHVTAYDFDEDRIYWMIQRVSRN